MSTKSTGGSGGNKPDVIDSVAGSSNDAIAKDNGDAAGDAAEAAQRLEQAEEHRKRLEAEQKKCRFCGGTGSVVYHDHSDGSSYDIQCSSCKGTGLSVA